MSDSPESGAGPSPSGAAPAEAPAAPTRGSFETEPGAAVFGVSPRLADPERDKPGTPSSMPTADSVAAALAASKGAPAGAEAPATDQPQPQPKSTDQPAAEEAPAAPADGKVKYSFGGYEAEAETEEAARAAVDHKIKTMRGSFRSAVEKRQAAEANYTQATQTAAAWERVARQLGYTDEGGVPAAADPNLSARPGAPTAPSTAAPSAPEEVPGVDWALYRAILADEKDGGPEVAQFFLVQEQNRVVEAKVAAIVSEKLDALRGEFEPVLQTHTQSTHLSAMATRLETLAKYEDPRTGQPAYPECSDNDALVAIGQILRTMGVNPEHVGDPEKVSDFAWHQAVLAYRYNKFGTLAPSAPPTPSAAPVETPRPPEGDAAAAAALAGAHPPAVRPAANGAFVNQAPQRHPLFGVAPR